MSCQHSRTIGAVKVIFLEDTGRWMIEVCVECEDCHTPFEFQGVDPGFSFDKPTISIDAQTVSLPACPHGEKPTPLDLIGYQMKGLQS